MPEEPSLKPGCRCLVGDERTETGEQLVRLLLERGKDVKLVAFGISALIAGVAGTLYAYNFGSVSADRFSVPLALSLIAFAYAGGITLVSGAVFAGLIAAQGLVPYALDTWFGLSGNWFLLFGGVVLIFTLIQNPEGVAGSFYRTAQLRAKRKVEVEVAESEPARAA